MQTGSGSRSSLEVKVKVKVKFKLIAIPRVSVYTPCSNMSSVRYSVVYIIIATHRLRTDVFVVLKLGTYGKPT